MKISRLKAAIVLIGVGTLFLPACAISSGSEKNRGPGYRDSGRVITALEKFYQEHGYYPVQLADLVPAYLAHLPEQKFDDYRVERNPGRFILSFTYTGPGVNHCTYDSASRAWSEKGFD